MCECGPGDFNETFDKDRLTIIKFTLDDFVESGLVDKINNGIELFIEDLKKLKASIAGNSN